MRVLKRHNVLDVYNRIEVSKRALLHNADFFRSKTGLQVIPVIKSNAYGHGIKLVAEALNVRNFPFLAVDGYFEALKIRKMTKTPILVMGMIKPEDFKKIRTSNIAFVVQDKATVDAIGSLDRKIMIHLDVDSGMNRYGIDPNEISEYLSLIESYPKLELDGVMTHLADPDGENERNIVESTRIFDRAVNTILQTGFKPRIIHIGQSASSLRLKSKYANATRIGLSLYGINPFAPNHKLHGVFNSNLRPALRLISTISKVNHLKAGEGVSYNYIFRAKKPMKVAVLPLGYYEGIDWRLGNKGTVKFGNNFLPIVGKVCMNHTMVDLGDTSAEAGDEVIVFSNDPKDQNSFNNIAEKHELFVYSLTTGLASDIRRVLI
jgi:alanine racemase